jgi:hypothetical protein
MKRKKKCPYCGRPVIDMARHLNKESKTCRMQHIKGIGADLKLKRHLKDLGH